MSTHDPYAMTAFDPSPVVVTTGRRAHFDCFSGVAGDMILGALVDAGWPIERLVEVVGRLGLPEVSVWSEAVRRGGLAATQVHVDIDADQRRAHRHLPDIVRIIESAKMPGEVTSGALRIFERLATAEARVHGIAVDQVHFHEVGASDAIVDIVGACVGLHELGVRQLSTSAIVTGYGVVECAHGTLPVPAPATAELLRDVPVEGGSEPTEMTTPTGAAVVTTLGDVFGRLPAMRVVACGYGAGTRENRARPNVLRVLIGEPVDAEEASRDEIVVLEAQVDDAPGQVIGYAVERLLDAGALDAYVVPIIMKKGRPGQLITVLATEPTVGRLEDVLLAETTTLGVRRQVWQRTTLDRHHETVTTRYGRVRMKVGRRGDAIVQAWPEYEDCVAAARQHDVALRDVQHEALRVWSEHGRIAGDQ